MEIECPKCQRRATIPDAAAGKKIKCGCGSVFQVEMQPRADDELRLSPVDHTGDVEKDDQRMFTVDGNYFDNSILSNGTKDNYRTVWFAYTDTNREASNGIDNGYFQYHLREPDKPNKC